MSDEAKPKDNDGDKEQPQEEKWDDPHEDGPRSPPGMLRRIRGRGPRYDFIPDWRPAFLKCLTQGMTVEAACTVAGISSDAAYKRRKSDKKFAKKWREAGQIGTSLLEEEAARRAYHGSLKPVFHKGVQCGVVREYSDTLMIFLLKARKPEVYRDQHEQGKSGGNTYIQHNQTAVSVLNQQMRDNPDVLELTDDIRRSLEGVTPLDLSGSLGDSGHSGQMEASPPPPDDQQVPGPGLGDAEQSDSD